MMDYLYDGSFDGLLTCIWHSYYTDRASGIYNADEYQSSLLGEFMQVETDEQKSLTVYKAIERKISPFDLRRVYKVYMSADADKENVILNYVVLGFQKGRSVSLLHGDPAVFAAQGIEKKVGVEVHRLHGLVRFRDLGSQGHSENIYYSDIEPDNDVVEFLAPHFCDRFKNQPFIIHDKKRNKALFSSGSDYYIGPLDKSQIPAVGEDELNFQKLWREYFENIAIKERTNPRCQRNFMPLRYHKYLSELNPQL